MENTTAASRIPYLLNRGQIMSERAAERGLLAYNEAYSLARMRKLLDTGQEVDPEQEAELNDIISKLTLILLPETYESIIKRRSSSYKSLLAATGIVIVVIALITLVVIIPINSVFNTAKSSISSADKLADTAVLQALEDYNRLSIDMQNLNRNEAVRTTSKHSKPADNSFLSEKHKQLDDLHLKVIPLVRDITSELQSICDIDKRYGIASGSIYQIITSFVTGRPNQVESNCSNINTIQPLDALDLLISRKKSVEPFMNLLSGTILPLLYGLLGSCIFMIRYFANTPIGLINLGDTAVGIPLRLGLGAIAGLALGWFNITEDVTKLTTTPIAVAFVAGFAIDILFDFLDRVVDAFRVSPPAASGQVRAARVSTSRLK